MDRKIDVNKKSESIALSLMHTWLVNAVENYQQIKEALADGRAECLGNIRGKHFKRPALVVGSGPTLALCLPHLKAFIEKTNCVVFSAMSNINTLLKYDIKPDYLCIYDANDRHEDEFFGIDGVDPKMYENTPMITYPEADPGFVKYWMEIGNKIYFHMRGTVRQEATPYNHYLMITLPTIYVFNQNIPKPIKSGIFNVGCVANQATVVSQELGCNPIYQVGVNFGYPMRKKHINPQIMKNGKWVDSGYGQNSEDDERNFESDNGVLTDETNILYKLALLTVWHMSRQDMVELSKDGIYGIMNELPKLDIIDGINGKKAGKILPVKRKAVVRKYYEDHGYGKTPEPENQTISISLRGESFLERIFPRLRKKHPSSL